MQQRVNVTRYCFFKSLDYFSGSETNLMPCLNLHLSQWICKLYKPHASLNKKINSNLASYKNKLLITPVLTINLFFIKYKAILCAERWPIPGNLEIKLINF